MSIPIFKELYIIYACSKEILVRVSMPWFQIKNSSRFRIELWSMCSVIIIEPSVFIIRSSFVPTVPRPTLNQNSSHVIFSMWWSSEVKLNHWFIQVQLVYVQIFHDHFYSLKDERLIEDERLTIEYRQHLIIYIILCQ